MPYKEKISCIYKITNTTNNKFYIGSTCNFLHRKCDHFGRLRRNKHNNIHLQRSFNKYGNNSFIIEPIEFCNNEDLYIREQFYVDTLKPNYNIRVVEINTMRGVKHTPESLLKMSISQKNRPPRPKKIKIRKNKGIKGNAVSIIQTDLCGKLIKEYSSISQAGKETNIISIMQHLKGRHNSCHAGGYLWFYREDYNSENVSKKVNYYNNRNMIKRNNRINKLKVKTKEIYLYDKNYNLIKIYKNTFQKQIAEELGYSRGMLSECLSGKNNSKNYILSYNPLIN